MTALGLCAALSVCGCGRSEPPPDEPADSAGDSAGPDPSQAMFELEKDHFNLGEVKPGTVHTVTVEVRNAGGRDLTVAEEKMQGLASLRDPEVTVPPGGHDKLIAQAVAPKKPGPFRYMLGLTSNDPQNPITVLLLTGIVVEGGKTVVGSTSPQQSKAAAAAELPGRLAKVVIAKPSLDAGQVKKGDPAKFDFLVRNEGTAMAYIAAKPGCGCTVADYDRKIAPGKTGHIRATLETKNYEGRTTKAITVTTNDPQNTTLHLSITVDVVAPVEVLPSRFHSVTLYEGESATVEFTLVANSGPALEIKSVKEVGTKLVRELKPAEIPVKGKPGKTRPGYKLLVTVPDTLPAKSFSTTYTLETNNPDERSLGVTVSGKVQKEITCDPPRLYLLVRGGVLANAPVIRVRKRSSSFRITKLDPRGLPLTLNLAKSADPKEQRVTVGYKGGWKPGFQSGAIAIHTNDKEQPIIEVPVTASVIEAPSTKK